MRFSTVLAGLIAGAAASVQADWNGTLLWDPPVDNEANVYARVIELNHAGDQNGKLLATWEHWYDVNSKGGQANGTQGSFIIRESDDGGNTWNTLSEVFDEQEGYGHPCSKFWQPFMFEYPHQIGQYPEGTIILVGNLVPTDGNYTQFFSWRSTDHGKSWSPIGEWQKGGPSPHGIWEPFIYLDKQGRMIAMFSDERDYENHSQKLVQVISEDGGDTWGDVIDIVRSPAQSDRPGMPTAALMEDGNYIMSYEICSRPMCPAHTKISADGAEWNADDVGTPVVTTDGIFPGSSPYIAWDDSNKRLVLAGLNTWFTDTIEKSPEFQRSILINTDCGKGEWYWAPGPWQVNSKSGPCNSNYSPNLLPVPNTNGIIRYTAPTAQGTTGLCAEGTGQAQIGTLPYSTDFATYQDSGWMDVGGEWKINGDTYTASSNEGVDAKALTGSTGWTNYKASADIMIPSDHGVLGVMARVVSPMNGTNAFLGYMASINTDSGQFSISREANLAQNPLNNTNVTSGVHSNTWYHIDFTLNEYNLEATLSSNGSDPTTITAIDNSFKNGMMGLLVRPGNGTYQGSFKNIAVEST